MKHKHSDKTKKSKKRKRECSGSRSSGSEEAKRKKKKRDHRKISSSDSNNSHHTKKRSKHCKAKREKEKSKEHAEPAECFDVPISLMNPNKDMAPMTKEEWEKRQSIVKKVFDETSGRYRLIKGDGEVIEEIVSKERHMEINQQATKGDGKYFQTQLSFSIKNKSI